VTHSAFGPDDVLTCPAPHLGMEDCVRLAREHWGVEVTQVTDLPSERDLNAMLDGRFVLKVSNPAEDRGAIDLESVALDHAAGADPDLPLPRTVRTRTGSWTASVVDRDGRECLARLITVLPGGMAEGRPVTTALAEEVGGIAARMSLALQGLFHPAAARELDWDVRRADTVLAGTDPAVLGLTTDELAQLRDRCAAAAEATRALPSGINHADVTLTNVLADEHGVTGLVDLGDIHHTANVCDLAVTVTSVVRNTADQQVAGLWQLLQAVVTGYQRHRLLTPTSCSPGWPCRGRSPRAGSSCTRTTRRTSPSTTSRTSGCCTSC
jgi:Ser/Thr protein kinase RdoA (MazF antagonist)